jgi:secreted PhoX family phosphatase
VPVHRDQLDDTATRLREAFGDEVYDAHFATNRPEDVEVAADGSVYIALTNNTAVNDSHGSVRRLRERGNDPEALAFTWRDYAAGGPTGNAGARGFSAPDNLVFDSAGNLWVVTDISSSRLNRPNEYAFHKNNAMFMVPTSGPNAGVAFRFANGPVECEITGPYFTPNEKTLFVNVQHPGENTGGSSTAPGIFGQETTYTSWWPEGNRTANDNPSTPKPSTVAITRDTGAADD